MDYLATEVAAKTPCYYAPYGEDGCGPLCEMTLLYSRLHVVNLDEGETLFDIPFERIHQIRMYRQEDVAPRQGHVQFNIIGAIIMAIGGVIVWPEKSNSDHISFKQYLQLDFTDENGKPQTHFFQRGRFGKLIKAFQRLKREDSLRK